MTGPFQLSSLRVSAEMESGKYTAGAQQKVAADKAMVASGREVSIAITDTSAKISTSGDVLARLSRQYVDGFASQQKFASGLGQLSRQLDSGKASIEQAATILVGMNQRLGLMANESELAAKGQTQLAAAVKLANAQIAGQATATAEAAQAARLLSAANANRPGAGLARAAGFNAGQQLQDIAMMAALGQSPMTLALQQGPQLASAIEMGGGLAALRTGLTSLIGPTTLITVGLTAATAAAIQYFSKSSESAEDLNKILSRQKDIIQSLGPAYEDLTRGNGPFENASVARLSLQANLDDARKTMREQEQSALKEARGAGGTFLSLIGSLPEGAQSFLGRNQTSIEFDRIIDAASKGEMSINDARIALAHFGEEHPDFSYIIGRFISMTNTAAETERQVKSLEGTLGRLGNPDRASVGGPAAMDRAQQAGREGAVMRQRFGDDPFADQREDQRKKEIELAKAQDERKRSLDATLASAKLDVDLIGRTTAEVEAQRMAFQLEQQVREEAARNNVEVDQAEIARIKQKAAEYGRLRALQQARDTIRSQQDDLEVQRAELGLIGQSVFEHDRVIASLKAEQEIRRLGIPLYGEEAEAIRKNTAELSALAEARAKASLRDDMVFERQQLFHSDIDQQIASRLRGTGLGLDSPEANYLRQTEQLRELRDGVKGFFSDFREGLKDGKSIGEAFGDAILNGLERAADKLLDNAIDSIINSLLGGNSSQPGSGIDIGGILGNLFGGKRSAFTPDTTLSSLLGYNQNGPNTAASATKLLSGLGSPLGAANDNILAPRLLSGMSAYRSAIASIESAGSGGYSALGPLTGSGDRAYGAYQVMGANIGPWSQAALGRSLSPSQFLASPSAQDAIFDHQFGSYLSRFGNPSDAASMWFTGRPLASGAGARDILGTSGSQYVDKFNAALGQATSSVQSLGSTTSATVSAVGSAALDATKGLGDFGNALNQFPAAPTGGGGGGLFGFLGNLFGGFGGGGLNSSFAGSAAYSYLSANPGGYIGLYAHGAAFSRGRVVPFANGGIYDQPTYFGMSGGRTGVMGEAGPEAIMPLRRGPDGKLGVAASTSSRPMNVQQNFILTERPQTPKSQAQIAARALEGVARAQRTA